MKANINNLILEVTRKCNMTCSHCLRGEAQNKDIDLEVIDSLLDQTEYISNVAFTGGEPSLNMEAMIYFLNACKYKNIEIGSFYICTNGLTVSNEFMIFVIELFNYCSDNEATALHVSRSDFHNWQEEEEIDKLKAFSFFSERENLDYKNLINEGRAKELNEDNGQEGRDNKIYDLTVEHWDDSINIDGDFYVNVKGDILTNCDLSYRRQDKNKIGNILNESIEEIINNNVLVEV